MKGDERWPTGLAHPLYSVRFRQDYCTTSAQDQDGDMAKFEAAQHEMNQKIDALQRDNLTPTLEAQPPALNPKHVHGY